MATDLGTGILDNLDTATNIYSLLMGDANTAQDWAIATASVSGTMTFVFSENITADFLTELEAAYTGTVFAIDILRFLLHPSSLSQSPSWIQPPRNSYWRSLRKVAGSRCGREHC